MDEKHDIIRQIFCEYDDSLQIKTISRPTDGYSNSVYFITFVNDLHEELVLKFIKPGDITEIVFYERVRQNAMDYFPVPNILKYDAIIRNYYISSKLCGLPLSQLWDSMTNEQRLETYREFGTLVGRLHSKFTYEKCGYLQGQQFHSWQDMFRNIIEKQVAQFKGTIFEELSNTIYKHLIQHIHLLDYQIIPRLLHMDLHCANILMINTKITGILDAEEALIGHNEYELMRIEKGHFEEAEDAKYRNEFISSYTSYVKLDDGYEERRRFYSLSRELVGMRCLLDYGNDYAQNGSIEQDMKKIEEKVKSIILM